MARQVIAVEQVQRGFRALLRAAADLRLDVPNAPEQIATFLARAVVDDALPPAFVEGIPDGAHASSHARLPDSGVYSCLMSCPVSPASDGKVLRTT